MFLTTEEALRADLEYAIRKICELSGKTLEEVISEPVWELEHIELREIFGEELEGGLMLFEDSRDRDEWCGYYITAYNDEEFITATGVKAYEKIMIHISGELFREIRLKHKEMAHENAICLGTYHYWGVPNTPTNTISALTHEFPAILEGIKDGVFEVESFEVDYYNKTYTECALCRGFIKHEEGIEHEEVVNGYICPICNHHFEEWYGDLWRLEEIKKYRDSD